MDDTDVVPRRAGRWWGADELESAGETFFPAELPRKLRELT